jgi:hypothetical protein
VFDSRPPCGVNGGNLTSRLIKVGPRQQEHAVTSRHGSLHTLRPVQVARDGLALSAFYHRPPIG